MFHIVLLLNQSQVISINIDVCVRKLSVLVFKKYISYDKIKYVNCLWPKSFN